MWAISVKYVLPPALNGCPKCKKLPNLVTLSSSMPHHFLSTFPSFLWSMSFSISLHFLLSYPRTFPSLDLWKFLSFYLLVISYSTLVIFFLPFLRLIYVLFYLSTFSLILPSYLSFSWSVEIPFFLPPRYLLFYPCHFLFTFPSINLCPFLSIFSLHPLFSLLTFHPFSSFTFYLFFLSLLYPFTLSTFLSISYCLCSFPFLPINLLPLGLFLSLFPIGPTTCVSSFVNLLLIDSFEV